MGDGADADSFDAGVGNRTNRLEVHAAGGFEKNIGRDLVSHLDGQRKVFRRHVVEQDDIWMSVQGLVELDKGIDFDFDNGTGANGLASEADGHFQRAGFVSGDVGEVIVLDEDGVE